MLLIGSVFVRRYIDYITLHFHDVNLYFVQKIKINKNK